MSQENVEVVRQGFEAFERGELDVMLDLFTDDVITYRVDPDGARYDHSRQRDAFEAAGLRE